MTCGDVTNDPVDSRVWPKTRGYGIASMPFLFLTITELFRLSARQLHTHLTKPA